MGVVVPCLLSLDGCIERVLVRDSAFVRDGEEALYEIAY